MVRYNGEISGNCSFHGWKEHYAENVATATWNWLKEHKQMQGTPLYFQIEEIFSEAMKASGLQWQIANYLEALYQ